MGSGFGFGRAREGNLELLERLSETNGYRAIGVGEVEDEQGVISSTRIRQAVREGDVEMASDLLGRSYAVTGRVVHGQGRGREQGWPTINIDPDHELLPRDGVYVSEVWLPASGTVVGAVTNVGTRPTFADNGKQVVEAHLFEFDRELYDERVELSFSRRLRGERRFPSADELVEQIGRDADAAREYLTDPRCSSLVPTLES